MNRVKLKGRDGNIDYPHAKYALYKNVCRNRYLLRFMTITKIYISKAYRQNNKTNLGSLPSVTQNNEMNLDKPQSHYLIFVNVAFLSTNQQLPYTYSGCTTIHSPIIRPHANNPSLTHLVISNQSYTHYTT